MNRQVITKFLGITGASILIYFVSVGMIEAGRVGNTMGYQPEQPINYSHKVHAGENKIPCLYCHYAARKGRHAGIPPLELCMNCHEHIKKVPPAKEDSLEIKKIADVLAGGKPLKWIRVHELPDFVYFNHSQHVTADVDCEECHGPVSLMNRVKQVKPLTMGWCLECHREKQIAPPNHVKSAGGGDCAKCHY